jgi:alginate O-acetyltransferase complex protein AlgI
MVFTDGKFFVFFLIVFSGYWALRSNAWRKGWLLLASMLFYATWDWRFLFLVLVVIVNTYAITLLTANNPNPLYRRIILTAGIVVSLGILGVFKYYNFFVESLSQLVDVGLVTRTIVLPIGISFYTFHSLSYMIDTYRGKIVPTRNLGDVALYILFFPQLVAGPIVRATDLLPQMRLAQTFASIDFKFCLTLFLLGYFKKAVISDNISSLVDLFFAHPSEYGAADAATAVFFYAVQIYCDFSGYTDMAIATAGMLGYELKPNFAHPYLAAHLIDFWRRWHISLSSWLRDYLYIPLGGNRGGPWFQARNLALTMLLGGLWHGASWTFVVWGGLHGLGLVVCRAWFAMLGVDDRKVGYSVLGNLLTFLWVCFAWIFFRASTFADAWVVLGRFTVVSPPVLLAWQHIVPISLALVVVHVLFHLIDLKTIVARSNEIVFACCYGAAVALVLPFVNIAVKPFIYFQF